jgi:hypothetical protein
MMNGHARLDVVEFRLRLVDVGASRRVRRRFGAGSTTVAPMFGLSLVAVGAAGSVGYRLIVTGALTLDTGVGRTLRPLGPLTVTIAAPRDTVFDIIAAPYLGKTPRALADEITVLERGTDMVLAAHHTPVGERVATTVETVRFNRPETVDFRLVRGPVPYVVERFTLDDDNGGTRLDYTGELGTDLWGLGRWWGNRVATTWEATVRSSLKRLRLEAERRAVRR